MDGILMEGSVRRVNLGRYLDRGVSQVLPVIERKVSITSIGDDDTARGNLKQLREMSAGMDYR